MVLNTSIMHTKGLNLVNTGYEDDRYFMDACRASIEPWSVDWLHTWIILSKTNICSRDISYAFPEEQWERI